MCQALVLFAVIYGVIYTDAICPSWYYSNSGRCYRYVSMKRSWHDARSYCQGMNSGDLLSIHTYSLKNSVWRHTEGTDDGALWVGAYSGDYWLDGSWIIRSWWVPGEPNNAGEKCVDVWVASRSRGTGLNDEECYYEQEFACQAEECYRIANCISGSRCRWNRSYFNKNECNKCSNGYCSGGQGKGCIRGYRIPNCISGPRCRDHNSYFTKNLCYTCSNGYYNGGHGRGCIRCRSIANCQIETCTSSSDQTCSTCINNFKLTNNGKSCDRMCSSDNRYCWPGSCYDDLATNCVCSKGFRRHSTAEETLCQPETKPEIHNCQTVFTGPNGEKKRLKSNTESSVCQNLEDIYGNFQPTAISVTMTSEFTIDISAVTRPKYVRTELFGVTDTAVLIQKQSMSGLKTVISSYQMKTDTTSGIKAKRAVVNNGVIAVDDSKYRLIDGDALCAQFKAEGGGYIVGRNQYTFATEVVTYDKTVAMETKCYKFDNAPPEHCSERNLCQYEPLQLEKRITRLGIVDTAFQGWSDPVPNPDVPSQASGIEHFEVRVREVIPAGDQLKVDTSIYYEEKVIISSTKNVILNLTTTAPRLFSVLLEVKDVADNIRQARRFVLFDNTSSLKVWDKYPFIINSAARETGYTWQTNFNKVCLTWKSHFYNDFYFHNPLLNPIEPDPHGLISGIYEHLEGILSVQGTPNVHGIMKYLVSWRLNEDTISEETEVANFLHQNFCREFDLKDGQTYTFYLRPVDIVQNTLLENRTVHVDTSPPHIDEIGLVKDGFKGLTVHDERDLSKMDLYFEALDPHSGILHTEWWFGTTDTGQELDSGVLGVQRIEGDCSDIIPLCYCPDVGTCENHSYIIPLNKLVTAHNHLGDHNRDYFFKIKTTNNAFLSATEYITILVDYSPPEIGVIHEGSVDGKDIDYTSEGTIAVHWYGFVDHESGINMYRIGFANRCLHRDELHHFENVTDILEYEEVIYTENSLRIAVDFTGKKYASIIAFNNAMDPSDSVCSDGITREINPPKLYNLSFEYLSIPVSYLCLDDNIWILNSDSTLYDLPTHNICNIRCSANDSVMSFIPSLPKAKASLIETKEICNKVSRYSNKTILYLPNDYINLSWNIDSGSQVDDIYVGIGLDPSEADSPQLIKYTSTNRKLYFKHRHEGYSSDETFYVFVKVVSKTGLEEITTIGPMLVDTTPPHFLKKPTVHILADNVMISWEENTFYDMEQKEQINRIEYTFGHEEKTISNRQVWNLITNQSCDTNGCCCIKYPLENLYKKDTDLGLKFYAKLYVYNNAGHFTEMTTDVFEIPSRYPPGHAVIFDIDPNLMELRDDIDVHFTPGILCASWTGFKHHKEVSIEVGVGSNDSLADVLPFQTYNGTMPPFCVNSSSFHVDKKYHILVKAVGSGGSTIAASDGVYILDTVGNILSKIRVYPGVDCASMSPIEELHIFNVSESIYRVKFDTKFEIGGHFSVFIATDIGSVFLVTLDSDDIILLPESTGQGKLSFTTLIEHPSFTLNTGKDHAFTTVTLKVVKCPSTIFLFMQKHIAAHWISSIASNVSSVWYEVGIVRNDSENALISDLEQESGTTHVFQNIRLSPSIRYKLAVKLCTKQICLNAVYSDIFHIEVNQPTGNIKLIELDQSINSTCFDIKMTWSSFTTDSEILFYQWSISKDIKAAHIVTPWKTVKPFYENKVNDCLNMQPQAYSSLFGCVKAYSLAGSMSMTCKAMSLKRTRVYYSDKYAVYDLDSSATSWNFVLSMVHSSDVSDTARNMLHDIDIDIAPAETAVAGAIMGTSGRNVTWYLMTSKHIPTSCSPSEGCHYSTITYTGFVKFPRSSMLTNKFYHICAYSNESHLQLENYTVPLDEFTSCSNGFIKDDIPPLNPKSVVHVSSQNGYITDTSRLIIQWSDFTDNVNASVFGYPENIRAYSYSIGSRKGREDIKSFSDVGHSTVVVARNVNISDGVPLFVTVKALDYVDLECVTVSMELIVDTTPPVPGQILIEPDMSDINTISFIDSLHLNLHLSKFRDDESGIAYFLIGIGTHRFLNNIMSLTKYNTNTVELQLEDRFLIDGRVYFINVQAVNNAGLSSTFVSRKVNIDRSPPTGGHVIDGDSFDKKDADFVNYVYRVGAQWKGFMDPHSGIHYFRCGFGTKPYMDDIRSFINVGLKESMEWAGPFVSGQTYYTTVEACNHARQCRAVPSDGLTLDNSPPVTGVVRIGSEALHHKYYPHTNWLHIHWVGFEDPQSGIDHYEVCVGTSVGECDVIQTFNTRRLDTNIIKTGLHLPVKKNLYATVRAYNKIGMNVSHTSDSFKIDNSPPAAEQTPRFINPLTLKEEQFVQSEKSILKISWLFSDHESPIINHEITLYTHHEGHTPIEHISLGSQNDFTINLAHKEWLHNGDIYYVKVTSCNAAGLCSTSQSADLLIDATAPHVGGFKQPLKWTNYNDALNETYTNLTLTWHEFHDQESLIERFYITVSRSYSGQELSGGIFIFEIKHISNEYTSVIPLVTKIFQDELLIVSIWAENQAGLKSSVARVSMYVLSETTNDEVSLKYGALEIEKHSCDIHYCNKDCTCAVFGQLCTYFESNSTCNEIASLNVHSIGFPTVDVRFGYPFQENQTVTPSSSCLSGTWKTVNDPNYTIERYEWSIGLSGQPIGDGIFDLKTERPWNDVGMQKEITYCLPVNRSLIHSESYILYIRAWYSRDKYATFTSNTIMVDQSAPAVRRGKFIKDSDVSCSIDYDFIDWTQNITACWSGVFSEQIGSITRYTVALGTVPKADDIFRNKDVGLATNITLWNMSFTHGTRYYFTVTAYNTAGLSAKLASDGFLVDTDNPKEGVVYNTAHMQNREFQSTDSSLSISWSGFTDNFSGIYQYHVAVSETDNEDALENLVFLPVVLKTFYTFNDIKLEQNKTYYGAVKASDAGGHFSNVAFSPGITIDVTKPTGIKCEVFRHVLNGTFLFNGSDESTAKLRVNVSKGDLIHTSMSVDSSDVNAKVIIGVGAEQNYLSGLRFHDGSIEFEYTLFAKESSETMISFMVSSTEDSRLNVFIFQCTEFEADDHTAVSVTQKGLSVLNINMFVSDRESKICSLQLGVGTTPGGFQVQPLKTFLHNSNHAIVRANIGHGSPIHVTGIAENCAGLKLIFKAKPIIMDHTAPFIDDVHTKIKVSPFLKPNDTIEQYVSIEASWHAKDLESGIKYCFCAIETHPGAQDVKPFWNADSQTSCFSGQLKLTEVDTIITAVKCVNTVELTTLHATDPQAIALQPPITEHGHVYILPSDKDNIAFKSDIKTFIQTSKYAVKFGWFGFEDAADISSYEYRLSRNGTPLTFWQKTVARDVVTLTDLKLEARNNYTAEVKASNKYGLISDTVSADVIVLEEKPRISGQSISINKQENRITLEWGHVFTSFEGIPVSYSLVIGTRKGFTDVINIASLTQSTYSITVPRSTQLSPNPTFLYIKIACSYPFGLDEVYEKTYRI